MPHHVTPHIPPLICRTAAFDFTRPYLVGILNVTPDSFSDGGMYKDTERAVACGEELAGEGADIVDVGGESSRPGAAPVPCNEELRRVIPVVEHLAQRVRVPLSVDTTKAEVARRAIDAGAEIINDISALRFDTDMAGVAARSGVAVILMHMRGTPQTMQNNTSYRDIIAEIRDFLAERIAFAVAAGIDRDKIIIDPGIGFGKSVAQGNFEILNRLEAFLSLNRPILVGPSRKAFLRLFAGDAVADRDWGTAAAVALAVYNGAHFIRVHDVAHMKIAARVAAAVRKNQGEQ